MCTLRVIATRETIRTTGMLSGVVFTPWLPFPIRLYLGTLTCAITGLVRVYGMYRVFMSKRQARVA